jgi:hypothetical protein
LGASHVQGKAATPFALRHPKALLALQHLNTETQPFLHTKTKTARDK